MALRLFAITASEIPGCFNSPPSSMMKGLTPSDIVLKRGRTIMWEKKKKRKNQTKHKIKNKYKENKKYNKKN